MAKRLSAVVLLGLVLLASAPAAEPVAGAPAAPGVLELLPGDAAVVLHIRDWSAWNKDLAASDFGQLWAEPEMHLFADPLLEAIGVQYGAFRKRVPICPDPADLRKAFAGGLALSVSLPSGKPGKPMLCAAVQLGDVEALGRIVAPFLGGQKLEPGKLIKRPLPAAELNAVIEGEVLMLSSEAAALEQMRARRAEAGPRAQSLAQAPAWKESQQLLGGPGHLSLFVSVATLRPLLLAAAPPAGADRAKNLLARTGLEALKSLTVQTGFRGQSLSVDLALGTDGPLQGALAPGEPFPADLLKWVPERTAFCSATRLNLAAGLELLRALLEPEDLKSFESGLGKLRTVLGVDLEKELLPLLGKHALLYEVGGASCWGLIPGIAVALPLTDAPKAQEVLEKALGQVVQMAGQLGRGMGPSVELREYKIGATQVHYLSVTSLPLAPCFAVVNQCLVLTPSLDAMRHALRQLGEPRNLGQAPAFRQALQNLSDRYKDPQFLPSSFNFAFTDPKQLSYESLGSLGQVLRGAGELALRKEAGPGGGLKPEQQMIKGLLDKLDFALFPSDETWARHVHPTASAWGSEAGGIVFRQNLSVPSPGGMFMGGGGLPAVSILAGLTLPVLARARESARRTSCASNLSQIGKACAMFADVAVNNGKYPKRLDELFDNYVADQRVFLCPSVKAHRAAGGKIKKCDYLYLPGGDPTQQTDVVAFCRCANHGMSGGKVAGSNVLVSDGHVEWMDAEGLRKAVRETLDRRKISLDLAKPASGKPLTAEQEKKLRAAIADLGSDDFEKREAGAKVLDDAGADAQALLEEGAKAQDAERREQCKRLLGKLKTDPGERGWIEDLRRELGMDPPAPAPAPMERIDVPAEKVPKVNKEDF